jgi:hypothetical protein
MGRPEIPNRPAIYVAYLAISLRIGLHSAEMAELAVEAKGIPGSVVSLCNRRTMADPAIIFLKVFIVCIVDSDVLRHIIHYWVCRTNICSNHRR